MYRDAYVKVNLDSLKYNINYFQKRVNKTIIAIIKANAYGTGQKIIYETLKEEGINFFGVSSLEEAIMLRNDGCDDEILILGYVDPKNINIVKKYNLNISLVSLEHLNEIIKYDCDGLKVHIKIDTGMNRIGLKSFDDFKKAIDISNKNNIKLEGVFTHFACSDKNYEYKTKEQYEIFKDFVTRANYDFKYIHCANSDESLRLKEDFSNTCRVGISLYGFNSYTNELKNVISLICKIDNIKIIGKGESVSYGAEYVASGDEIIATLPIGYADGWNRNNSGREVYVENNRAVIVGKICMDQLMVRLDKMVPLKTTVELFGDNLSIEKVARENNTISYEIISSLSDRLTRVYYKDNKYFKNYNPRLNMEE